MKYVVYCMNGGTRVVQRISSSAMVEFGMKSNLAQYAMNGVQILTCKTKGQASMHSAKDIIPRIRAFAVSRSRHSDVTTNEAWAFEIERISFVAPLADLQ